MPTAAFLFLSLTLFCQNNKIEFIPKIGCSMNSVYDPSSWTYKFSPLLFGFDSSKKFTEKIGVNAELYFIRKGTHSKKNSDGQRYQNYEFDYLIFSPQFTYNIYQKFRLDASVGPYLGYAISAEAKFYPDDEFTDYKPDQFKDFDFGLDVSFRKYFNISNRTFVIQPKFQLGLITFSYTKHISFQLSVGMLLNKS